MNAFESHRSKGSKDARRLGLKVPIRMNSNLRDRPILGMLPAREENATYNVDQTK